MLDDERESAWMYDRLAEISRSESTSATLRDLAAAERRHARHWAERLGEPALADVSVRPTVRVRALILLARVAGVDAVLPRLRAAELEEIGRYDADPDARALADEERAHRAILGALTDPTGAAEAEHGFASASTASTFRAALFGLNDGLVSNLSLVAGVAGAAIDSDAVLVAGIAGWLAGAICLGAGE